MTEEATADESNTESPTKRIPPEYEGVGGATPTDPRHDDSLRVGAVWDDRRIHSFRDTNGTPADE